VFAADSPHADAEVSLTCANSAARELPRPLSHSRDDGTDS
jgi:hypothetical protein